MFSRRVRRPTCMACNANGGAGSFTGDLWHGVRNTRRREYVSGSLPAPPPPSPIHTPSYAQAAALAAATRLSTHAPLLTAHPNTVGMAMSGGQTNCDVPPLHFHKNNDHDDHDDRMAAATVAVVGSGDAPEPTPMPSSSDGQTCAVHAATAAANSLATAPHDRCRSLLQRAPRASTPSANGAYLL